MYKYIEQVQTDPETKIKYTTRTYEDYICLDTETSHTEHNGEEVCWMTTAQVLFRNQYYLFRTPMELMGFLNDLIKTMKLTETDKVVIYIHNASYDLAYLVPYIRKYITHYADSNAIQEDPGLSIILASQKILMWRYGCFEFRDSYRLSGMSLDKWCKELDVEHKKLVGLYDYSKVIYQDTILTEEEKAYDKNDVLAMRECIDTVMTKGGYNIVTIPLTATQFIRKELKASCQADKNYRKEYFNKMRLTVEDYEDCLLAYSGGYTHGNRYWMNRLLEVGKTYPYRGKKIKIEKIMHRDFKSHYPTQMTCYQFPVTGFKTYYDYRLNSREITIDEIVNLSPKYATKTVMIVNSLELKDEAISMPFAQFDKFIEFGGVQFKCEKDNGRILKATGAAKICVADKTLRILNEQYNIKGHILTVKTANYGYLPKCITDIVNKHFKGKSDYKNKEKELEKQGYSKNSPELKEATFLKGESKKRVNALYGCCATKPLRESYCITGTCEYDVWKSYTSLDPETDKRLKAAGLSDYYSSFASFLPYQWGVWITENARWELYEFIKCVGYDHVLYADTDSLFYISTPEIEDRIQALNDQKHQVAQYVVLDNGVKEYYDEFCLEDDCPAQAFKGLHSKCYGVVNNHGKLDITIAGIPQRTLVDMDGDEPVYYTREQELAGVPVEYYKDPEYKDMKKSDAIDASIKAPVRALDNLKDSFAFHTCTGTTAKYVGARGLQDIREPQTLNINGHLVYTAGGCIIEETVEKVITYHGDMEAYQKDDE